MTEFQNNSDESQDNTEEQKHLDETPSDPESTRTEEGADSHPDGKTKKRQFRKPKKRTVLVATALLLAVAGGITWWLVPKTADLYYKALLDGEYVTSYPNKDLAVLQGEAVCAGLKAGEEPVGFDYQKVAVDFFCKEFGEVYEVIPTPLQQQELLVTALRDADLGGLFASDAAAVASAQAVCEDLRQGGENQGVLASFLGVEIYCNEFASGYTVLEEIDVVGKFYLYDNSYWWKLIHREDGKCWGVNSYDDMRHGTDVTIRNSDGEKLTETVLGNGKWKSGGCVFEFKFTVLEGEDDYMVEVGNRGEVGFEESDLKTPDGVEVYLG